MSLKPASSRSRKARMRPLSAAISSFAMRKASPMPTIWWVGSVPERKPRSWPPPWICGSMRTRGFLRTYSAPMPFGPYTLCAVTVKRSAFSFCRSIGIFPAADLADLGYRLDYADLVVHHHHRHEDGIGVQGRLEFFQVEQPVLLRIE